MNVQKLQQLLIESKYDSEESKFILQGFKEGFSIGYNGNQSVKMKSPNLKLTVGTELDLWNKVMKEVKLKRYAGTYLEPPFENFIQSPIGLVPKDGGKDTRLIFHLSYPRGKGTSLNANTPPELCSVTYPDFLEAVKICLLEGKKCNIARSDLQSAFRNLGILKKHFCWLVMKARSPIDGKWYFFVDKCLPFGSSISCSHFQRVSNCIKHLVQYRSFAEISVRFTGKNFLANLQRNQFPGEHEQDTLGNY